MLNDVELISEIQNLTLDYLKQKIARETFADLVIGLLEENGRHFTGSARVPANDG